METIPEIRMAVQMVTANSRKRRPRMPAMNIMVIKTAASESVMETMVKPISREPVRAACIGVSPISMWRTMFSSMTMASSTTNPMERISAILISGMVSISLTPMLCSRFLREHKGEKHGIFYRAVESAFNSTRNLYGTTLHWVLGHRPVMLAMFVAVLLVTADLYRVVPKGFIPDTDNDNFSINVEAAQGTSYYQMVKYQQLISSIVVQDPDIESFFSSTGGNFGGSSGASGRMMINTKPRRQRNVTVAEMVNRLRA